MILFRMELGVAMCSSMGDIKSVPVAEECCSDFNSLTLFDDILLR